MLAVLSILLLAKKITPIIPLRFFLASRIFRKKYRGYLPKIQIVSENCYAAPVPPHLLSDIEGFSRLVVFEDGNPLVEAHVAQPDIKLRGRGAYIHWGEHVFFSSSDNSDPTANGRTYSVREI